MLSDGIGAPATGPLSCGPTASSARMRAAWLCALVLLFEGYDIAAVGYVVPSLVEAWRAPPAAFTTTLTAGNTGLLIGSILAGSIGDRVGRKPVLVACVSAFGVFSLASAFAGSPSQLTLLRFATGLGLGGGIPIAIALTADFAAEVSKGRFVMLASLGIPIGFAVTGFMARALVSEFGWPSLFVVGGLAPLAMAMSLVAWLPEAPSFQTVGPKPQSVAALFRNGRGLGTALLWAVNLLNLLTIYFLLLWTPTIARDIGVGPAAAIVATTVYSLGVVASPAATSLIVDRIGIERVVTITLAFGTVCILAIGLLEPPYAAFVALLFGAGCGVGAQGGVNALSGLMYPSDIRATGAGWALGFGRVGGVLGPLFGGLLLSLGLTAHAILASAAAPAFAAAAMMAWLGRVRTRGDTERAGASSH
jgi:MFS transporter, AAHS family, 4-hydroxybenzoate transporter